MDAPRLQAKSPAPTTTLTFAASPTEAKNRTEARASSRRDIAGWLFHGVLRVVMERRVFSAACGSGTVSRHAGGMHRDSSSTATSRLIAAPLRNNDNP